jgi:hypothetical protein
VAIGNSMALLATTSSYQPPSAFEIDVSAQSGDLWEAVARWLQAAGMPTGQLMGSGVTPRFKPKDATRHRQQFVRAVLVRRQEVKDGLPNSQPEKRSRELSEAIAAGWHAVAERNPGYPSGGGMGMIGAACLGPLAER